MLPCAALRRAVPHALAPCRNQIGRPHVCCASPRFAVAAVAKLPAAAALSAVVVARLRRRAPAPLLSLAAAACRVPRPRCQALLASRRAPRWTTAPSQWVERGPRFGTSRHRLLGACRSVAAAVCCYCAPSVCRLRTESFAPSAMVACLGRERRALTPAFQRARVNPHEPTPHSPGTHTPLFSRFYPLHSDQVDNLVRCLERDGSSRGC